MICWLYICHLRVINKFKGSYQQGITSALLKTASDIAKESDDCKIWWSLRHCSRPASWDEGRKHMILIQLIYYFPKTVYQMLRIVQRIVRRIYKRCWNVRLMFIGHETRDARISCKLSVILTDSGIFHSKMLTDTDIKKIKTFDV